MLNALVSSIDKTLRTRQRIFEYSRSPRCVFRVQLAAAETDIALSDGTCLVAGSHLMNLHLWNEHVPPFPANGPTLGWARQMCDDLEISLEELAAFIASCSAFEDIAAIGGRIMFGSTEQTQLVSRVAARYGFVRAVDTAAKQSLAQRLYLVGENILISMLVISYNPAALRADWLWRDRVPLYIRRAELLKRFGAREGTAQVHQPKGERKTPSRSDNCK